MSMLLDAVRRSRQLESQDPALAPVMPGRRKRVVPWHWGLPVVTLAVGAALGYLTLPGQPNSAPVAEAQPPQLTLAQTVSLPVPTPLQTSPVRSQPAPKPTLAQVTEVAIEGVEQPIEVSRDAESAARSEPVAEPTAEATNPALLAALEQALADMGEDTLIESNRATPVVDERDTLVVEAPAQPPAQVRSEDLPKLGQMPWAFQKRLPDVEITAHVYATDPANRWLRANGRELQEGDEAAPGLTVAEILPNEVVLEMDGERFRVPALGSL
ncbi:general secretion pathway protein GspB [Halomonas denitrificans]|nr:general secretion pathway protein GspB [Halomonas denitrificans]